jgi:hypothetical protein
MPLIRRAIKLLADREMTPHLGLLKSTLLQLDSSFSERAYGAGSFRDFVEKLAKAGHVAVKGSDRSIYVELRETGEAADSAEPRGHERAHETAARSDRVPGLDTRPQQMGDNGGSGSAEDTAATPTPAPPPSAPETDGAEAAPRPGAADGLRVMIQAFSRTGATPRFPMYVRQLKHFLKAFDESFDERRYGFAGILDALRFGQREGLFRLDRDRQGGVRVHPGAQYQQLTQTSGAPSVLEAGAPSDTPRDAPPSPEAEIGIPQGDSSAPDQSPAESEPARVEAGTLPVDREIDAVPAGEAAPEVEPTPASRPSARKRATVRPRTAARPKKAAAAPTGVKKPTVRRRTKKD